MEDHVASMWFIWLIQWIDLTERHVSFLHQRHTIQVQSERRCSSWWILVSEFGLVCYVLCWDSIVFYLTTKNVMMTHILPIGLVENGVILSFVYANKRNNFYDNFIFHTYIIFLLFIPIILVFVSISFFL